MAQRRRLKPAEVESARLGYADGSRTVAEVATSLGVFDSTVYALAKRFGWPPRRTAPPGWAGAGGSPGATLPAGDLSGQLAKLERIAASAVSGLETALASGTATDPERAARALAIHVRTLAGLQKLVAGREGEPAHDEPPPRTLSELRDELRGHLERLRLEERDREFHGGAEPYGGRDDAPALAGDVPAGAAPPGELGRPG